MDDFARILGVFSEIWSFAEFTEILSFAIHTAHAHPVAIEWERERLRLVCGTATHPDAAMNTLGFTFNTAPTVFGFPFNTGIFRGFKMQFEAVLMILRGFYYTLVS